MGQALAPLVVYPDILPYAEKLFMVKNIIARKIKSFEYMHQTPSHLQSTTFLNLQ